MKDEFGRPLTRSFISREFWDIKDQVEFRRRVRDYFALGYPGWSVEKIDRESKIVWIKDNRR